MLAVVVWLSIPILFVGVGTAALRGDLTSVLKRGLGAPVLMAVGTAVAVPVTAGVLTLVNGCCGLLVDVAIGGNQGFGQGLSHLSDFALSATVASGGSGLPGLAAALIVALAGLAALAIWFVLALRGALLYLEVLAVPLALCGLYWGGTAHWIKKLIDLIVATILSQLVITMLMVLAAADLNKNQLAVNGSVSGDMTTLFLAVAFLVLGSLALPMALRHVPAATEHAAAAASQISAPGRMTYMGSRIAGTAKMMGGSGGGTQAIVRQAGAAAGPLGVAASAGVGAATSAARSGVDAATGAANAAAGGERRTRSGDGQHRAIGIWPRGRRVVGRIRRWSRERGDQAGRDQRPRQDATDLRHGRRRLAKRCGAEPARDPRCEAREVPLMTEPEVLYNFGVLTKRYELVSRTAGQLAPGIAGLLVGFLMIVAGAPLPLPFAPVLVGFWFALGKIPFGRHRGARVRSRGRTARPLLVSATRRQDPLGDARHVVERGGRPGRHPARSSACSWTRRRPSSSWGLSNRIGETGDPRHRVAESVAVAERAGRPASRCPPSWAGCAGWRCTSTGPKPASSSSGPDARTSSRR